MMNVGDLVRYKHRKQDVGLIINIRQYANAARYKVLWTSTPSQNVHQTDWMQLAGLELISASR